MAMNSTAMTAWTVEKKAFKETPEKLDCPDCAPSSGGGSHDSSAIQARCYDEIISTHQPLS
jgi:hypothetical protein